MKFGPDNPPKGRPPGSKNKLSSLRERLEEEGLDFASEFKKNYDELADGLPKLKMLAAIAPYIHPQLAKSEVESMISTNAGPTISIVLPSNGREIKTVDQPESFPLYPGYLGPIPVKEEK